MRDDVHAVYDVPLDKIVTIGNPVDGDWIERRAAAGGVEGFSLFPTNILAVGRLDPVKGFDMLLDAMGRIEDTDCHLHIIGDGGERGALERRAVGLGIADRVTFHGFKKNPYPYMRAADLFVLSSRYEGFPNVVMEALALGCPVVAFDCPGGTAELIEHGSNGFLVPAGDVGALAREIARGGYRDLDRGAIEKAARERHAISAIVERYEELFDGGARRARDETEHAP
jgi:glycosyltransferase involved in cell wall biosynthesis